MAFEAAQLLPKKPAALSTQDGADACLSLDTIHAPAGTVCVDGGSQGDEHRVQRPRHTAGGCCHCPADTGHHKTGTAEQSHPDPHPEMGWHHVRTLCQTRPLVPLSTQIPPALTPPSPGVTQVPLSCQHHTIAGSELAAPGRLAPGGSQAPGGDTHLWKRRRMESRVWSMFLLQMPWLKR